MTRKWTEEDVTKALKKMTEVSVSETSADQIWFKIDEKISVRKNHVWNHITWKPWSHPIRWVMVTACLCVASTGVVYHANSMDQSDMDAYLISISNPTANITKDLGAANVSVLLGESFSSVPEVKVDDHLDSIAADEVLL